MNAAIYARKSIDENGADADAKSVSRQVESAGSFAAPKGWTAVDERRILLRGRGQRCRDAPSRQRPAAP